MNTIWEWKCDPDDETAYMLSDYGKKIRHEIYRMCGVFQKHQRIFYPHHNHDDEQARYQNLIYHQGAALYQIRKHISKVKLPYIAIWGNQMYDWNGNDLHLFLHRKQESSVRQVNVPVIKQERYACDISCYRQNDLILCLIQNQWYAYLIMN